MTFVIRRLVLLLVTAKNGTKTIERPARLSSKAQVPNLKEGPGFQGVVFRQHADMEAQHYKFNDATKRSSPQPTSIGSYPCAVSRSKMRLNPLNPSRSSSTASLNCGTALNPLAVESSCPPVSRSISSSSSAV